METFMVDRSKKWTVEDYLQLEEDVKCEILDGELLMTPAPLISHQRTLASLYQQLFFYIHNSKLGNFSSRRLMFILTGKMFTNRIWCSLQQPGPPLFRKKG